jgi:beta-carotene 3-hydroxylase
MNPILYVAIIVVVFLIMEGVSWVTHRYVMHGFLWTLHEDHHVKRPGFFERNDAFFIIFAVPSFFLILFGTIYSIYWMQALGFGVMSYGFAYFLVHEVIIHQRFKWFTRSNNKYIRTIRWAHKMHHKHLGKEDGESFGMLMVHKKYWEKIKRDRLHVQGKKEVVNG